MKLIDAGMDEITAKEISEYINLWIEVNIMNWKNINDKIIK